MMLTIEELERNPSYQLWLATNAWQRAMRRVLEPFGLTHMQFVLLSATDFLSNHEPDVTQAHLARVAIIDETMASQVIRSLVEKGLLSRPAHPTDRRAKCLLLTESGANLVVEARVEVRKAKVEFFAPIESRLDTLVDLLSAVSTAAEARFPFACEDRAKHCGEGNAR